MKQKNSKLANVIHARHTGRLIQQKLIQHLRDPQIPESSCLMTWLNEPQAEHVFCTAVWSAVGMAPTISLCLSTNSSAKPPDACHAMWQCVSQVPGLSSLKAIARYCYSIRQRMRSMDMEKTPSRPVAMPWAKNSNSPSDQRTQKTSRVAWGFYLHRCQGVSPRPDEAGWWW